MSRRRRGLSNQFATIMKTAGVVVTLGKAEEGKDRQMRNKGFSALFRFFQYLLLIKLRIFS